MKIFLESHNLKNKYSGFGQFNFHLIKSISNLKDEDFQFILNVKNIEKNKAEFGNYFNYHQYRSISRYPLFRVQKKVDLWHSMNQNTKIEPAKKTIYLNTIHDVNFLKENKGDKLKESKKLFTNKLKRSSALVYISEYAKKSTHQFFDVPKIPEFVIYNGNPFNKNLNINLKKPQSVSTNRPFIFSIGQCLEKKNFHTLVKMMTFLPNYNLYIAGKKKFEYAQKVVNTIKELKLEDRVFLLGEVTEAEKHFMYANCKAFAFPSLLEGFGIPPLEAMSYGKPVFLSTKTSLPEVGGEEAFYWDNFDPKYMSQTFEKNMTEYEAQENVFEEKLKARANYFSWDKAAKEYLKVYKQLLNL